MELILMTSYGLQLEKQWLTRAMTKAGLSPCEDNTGRNHSDD